MEKVTGEMIPDEVLADLSAKIKDEKVKFGMIAYVDEDNNLVIYGDGHSIATIVTNIVFGSLHEHLHQAEEKFDQLQEFGIAGFIPDKPEEPAPFNVDDDNDDAPGS